VRITASAAERRYLTDTFAELCRIESPSGRERACAQKISTELGALGLDVEEDDTAAVTGSDSGNLLVGIPAHRADSQIAAGTGGVLLCAHMDTVPLAASIEPVLVDGGWENANEGILGADNKAAIAVMLTFARHFCQEGSAVDIELLFTVGEEQALKGARAFDVSRLSSGFGYVFDHASPIGEIVMASPSHSRLEVGFRGAAAHAGIRPEQGSSAILAAARAIAAMRLGRLDEQTTVNVGTIHGGSAMNVVPEYCSFIAEVRSLQEQHGEAVLGEIVDKIHEAANLPECDCDVDISIQRTFSGYDTEPGAPAVTVAQRALRDCGYEPVAIVSGGASDANALLAKGFTTVNLANGTERNHEPGERVSQSALEGMLDVALALPGAVMAQSLGA
jgi:tripeptide aminopeptidase